MRAFLVHTHLSFGTPSLNWGIERWNYARYIVAPMLGSQGTEAGVPPGALRAIRTWEKMIGLWENERGNILGMTNIEHPDPVGTHPDFRRRGLARAVVLHGLHKLAALGATRVPMISTAPLYEAIGFRKFGLYHPWIKTFEPTPQAREHWRALTTVTAIWSS